MAVNGEFRESLLSKPSIYLLRIERHGRVNPIDFRRAAVFEIMKLGSMMSELYDAHKDEDGFLYLTYSAENTLGGRAV